MKKILALLAILLASATSALAAPVNVVIETTKGNIDLALDQDKAPATVANFLQYADEGYYNDTIFHRVINGFMIQGGGITADMNKKDTREPVKNEAKNGLKNIRGSIAMARTSDPHSATSQFFINHKDNTSLDYPSPDGWGYTVFGQVTSGMDVVDAIANSPTGRRDVPTEVITIKSIKRLDK
jgi:cyclophilin family peptidyl-prolyl cis-trans isomerase